MSDQVPKQKRWYLILRAKKSTSSLTPGEDTNMDNQESAKSNSDIKPDFHPVDCPAQFPSEPE